MLVERDIIDSYQSQLDAATEDQKKALDLEVESLRTWGERWGRDMEDAPVALTDVMFLIALENGEIEEVSMGRVIWKLEAANRIVIKKLDDQIVGSYISMKKAGFPRPSSLLCRHMFVSLFATDQYEKYDADQWKGMTLVLQRLHSTCRAAFRFDNEKYHRRVVHREDGSSDIVYGKKQWRRELVARKVIQGRG
jgi:hypothetical protein